MAADLVRQKQDLSGQFRSDGHLFAGNSFNTGGGPVNITSDSMSDAIVLPFLVCCLSGTNRLARTIPTRPTCDGSSRGEDQDLEQQG